MRRVHNVMLGIALLGCPTVTAAQAAGEAEGGPAAVPAAPAPSAPLPPEFTSSAAGSTPFPAGHEFRVRVGYRARASMTLVSGSEAVELVGGEGDYAHLRAKRPGAAQVKVQAVKADGKNSGTATFLADVYDPEALARRMREVGPATAGFLSPRVLTVLDGATKVELYRLDPQRSGPAAKARAATDARPVAVVPAPAAATRPAPGPAQPAGAVAGKPPARVPATPQLYGFRQLGRVEQLPAAPAARVIASLTSPGLVDTAAKDVPAARRDLYANALARLDDEDYKTREAAERTLIDLGPDGLLVADALVADNDDPELRLRLDKVKEAWQRQYKEVQPTLAVRVHRNGAKADFLVDLESRRVRLVSTARLGDGSGGTGLIDQTVPLGAAAAAQLEGVADEVLP